MTVDQLELTDPTPTGVAGPRPPATVLRGPEHADNYRIRVGRYKDRWYRDPLPYDALAHEALSDESYPSVSTVKGASGKDWTFVALKRVAHAADLTEIAGKGYFERYERLKVVNQLDLSQAMRRGTNVHTWAECRAYGVAPYLPPSADGANYFPIVDKLWAELQPELVAAEVVAFHRTLNGVGYGGTSDGIFRIFGKLYMVDWKSRGEDSDHGAYPEEAGQLGAYCGAQYIVVADDDPANPHGAKRIAVPELDGALIVSIKPDSYEVYPVDLPKAIAHFEAMHAWWCARRSEGKTIGSKWAPRRVVDAVPHSPTDPPHDRRAAMYVRVDALTKAQQEQLGEQLMNVDITDLDEVERILHDVENPPSVLELANRRMTRDAEREVDRRLSAEGGPANGEDVMVFELRWDVGLNNAARSWLSGVVSEAARAGVDFRYSALPSQRRCDLFNALTEWATLDQFDARHDQGFRMMLDQVGTFDDLLTATLGKLVGSLSTEQAAALRDAISAATPWNNS